MSDEDDKSPEDALRDMLRDMLAGNAELDPQKLAGAAGLPSDPASIQQLITQLQGALRGNPDGSINWDLALQQGRQLAMQDSVETAPGKASALEQAFHVAELWLDEATSVGALVATPALLSRGEWVKRTMPLWTQLAEPVANSIADSLTRVMNEQAPDELRGMLGKEAALGDEEAEADIEEIEEVEAEEV